MVSSFFLFGCDSSRSSNSPELALRPLVRDQISEEGEMFLSNAGIFVHWMGDVKGVAWGENYAYLYVQEEGRSIQLAAKTDNGGWVSIYNWEPEGISYDKLDYFHIPYDPICSTIPCFWVSDENKNTFLYQVILRQSMEWSWKEIITWDIWEQKLRYWQNWDQRYEITTFHP